jgi:hypothetical protein
MNACVDVVIANSKSDFIFSIDFSFNLLGEDI